MGVPRCGANLFAACKKMEYAILSTNISAGERLPSIRAMAELLKISPNTVMKAYVRLCQSGLIISSRNGHYSVIDNEQYILQAKIKGTGAVYFLFE